MNELVRRIAFEIQDAGMNRLDAQRIVAAVLGALRDGDRIGNDLIVRRGGNDASRDTPLEQPASD